MKPQSLSEINLGILDASSESVWLQVGQLLDPVNRRCLRDAHIVYDASEIRYTGEKPPPAALQERAGPLRLPDVLALPPLFDAHTHINLSGGELDPAVRKAAQSQPPERLLAEANARAGAILRMGVRGMRDGGDKDGVGLALSAQGRAGDTTIARVFSPGAGVHRKGRYGSFFSRPLEEFASEADCVMARASAGADHLKIVPTGIINFGKGTVTGRPQFSAGEMRAFKDAAPQDLLLMAHASGEDGIENAINGGVNTIEHGYFITPDQLARMRDENQIWVPTFVPVHRQVVHADVMGWENAIVDSLHRILEGHARSLNLAMELGVRILVGSDAGSYGVPHAIGLFEEIWLMSQAGMSSTEALCRAIHDNPAHLVPDWDFPGIKQGSKASFLLSPPSALEDARQLAQAVVILQGIPSRATESDLF